MTISRRRHFIISFNSGKTRKVHNTDYTHIYKIYNMSTNQQSFWGSCRNAHNCFVMMWMHQVHGRVSNARCLRLLYFHQYTANQQSNGGRSKSNGSRHLHHVPHGSPGQFAYITGNTMKLNYFEQVKYLLYYVHT